MLYSVMGPQGTGKTSLLNELKRHGYPAVERKTSRSILADWNVTLSEVNNNFGLTIKFQEEIIKRKHEDEKPYIDSPDIWFTERTFIDAFVYTLINLGKDNEYSDWLDEYYERCTALLDGYKHIFFLQRSFQIVGDGVRGTNSHYVNNVDMLMNYYANQLSKDKVTFIDTANVYHRVDIILSQIENS